MHLGSPLLLQGIHAGPKGSASQASKEARRQLHQVVKDLMGQQHGDPLIDPMKSIYSILAINLAVHKKAIKVFLSWTMSSPVLGLWQGTLAQYRGGALQPLSNALIMDLWALPGLAGLAKSSAPFAPASWASCTCSLMFTALSLLSRYLLFCFGFLAQVLCWDSCFGFFCPSVGGFFAQVLPLGH